MVDSPAVYGLLALIMLLGTLLRFINLASNSYWMDELFTVNQVLHNPHLPRLVQSVLRGESGPPLYQICLFFHIRLFGYSHSEQVVRGLSAAFGVLTILFFYFLAAHLFNKRRGLICALFLTVAYLPIYYAQEARPYALLVCLTVLSNWFFLRIFFPKDRNQQQKFVWDKANILIYFFATLFLLLTHYYGLLILLFQILFIGVMVWIRYLPFKRVLKWLVFYTLLGIVYWFLWGHNLFAQYDKYSFCWIRKPRFGLIISFVTIVLTPNLGGWHGQNLIWLGLLFISLPSCFIKVFRARSSTYLSNKRAALSPAFSYLWLFLPYMVAYGQSMWGKASILPGNLIIVSPALFLALLISGEIIIWLFLKKIRRYSFQKVYLKLSFFIAVFIALLIFLGKTSGYYRQPIKEDFRGVVKAIIEESPQLYPEPLIFCVSSFVGNGFNYYFTRAHSSLEILTVLNDSNYRDVLLRYREQLALHKYLVFISQGENQKTLDYLKTQARLMLRRELTGIAYYVFIVPASSARP